ncbi:MAG: hypothetical protein EPO08_20660, partial [Rhodospirillaceae bacterium]
MKCTLCGHGTLKSHFLAGMLLCVSCHHIQPGALEAPVVKVAPESAPTESIPAVSTETLPASAPIPAVDVGSLMVLDAGLKELQQISTEAVHEVLKELRSIKQLLELQVQFQILAAKHAGIDLLNPPAENQAASGVTDAPEPAPVASAGDQAASGVTDAPEPAPVASAGDQ